jgi:flagellar FliL protein
MAAEQDLKLDNGGGAEEAPKSKKKLIIIIIIAVLVLAGAGVGAALFFLGGDEETGTDGEEAAVEEVVEEPALPAQYVVLKPEFVVSFQVGPRQRFLQLNIEVMTRKQSVVDALNLHEPMVRNDIIRIIGEQNFDYLRTAEGRVALQEQLLQHLAQLVQREAGTDGVEAVLFTDFVMQ